MSGNATRNVAGARYVQPKPEPGVTMANFDRLPKEVRQAIAGANFDFEVIEIVERMQKGMPPATAIAAIKNMNERLTRRAEEERYELL